MEKAGKDAVWEPSLTVTTIFLLTPTSGETGVPLNTPVCGLKLAQNGRPLME